ncbi:LysM peptidoglycan-binding domain-containing protein [Saxibacter everestensis]|uniref:LysM peptidoglycan-binding domain-containing protein n=1 Tax=Saxibacter everestensis TaxID=2909229 RepID=A0ABY8QY43_9MICO|nr:LysM peptidoglycan-binding domain-containing protein [Brevibacteriaceae bacterium ZFBP1038]
MNSGSNSAPTTPDSPRKGLRRTAFASTPLMVAAMLGSGSATAAAAETQPLPDETAAETTGAVSRWTSLRAGASTTDTAHGTATTGTGSTQSGGAAQAGAAQAGAAQAGGASTYTVRDGETVSAIALRLGVSTQDLLRANRLSSRTVVHPGRELTVPSSSQNASGTSDSARPAKDSYQVEAGDTLLGIALRHRTTVPALQKANGMGTSTLITIGQSIKLSGKGSVSDSPRTKAPDDLPHVPKKFAGRSYPDETVNAARINKKILLSQDLPSRSEMKSLVASTARANGVDPALALAVAEQESGFNMAAVSPANAIGTMQVIPASGRWASDLSGRKLNLLIPKDNVTAGVVILKKLLAESEDEPQAIASYYQGLTSVRENGMYDDTRRYVNSVRTLKSRY